MKTVAFVTSSDDPHLIGDDLLMTDPLAKLGYRLEPLVWDQPNNQPEQFDAIVFRSCWNYHRKFQEFLSWLQSLESLQIPIFNSLEINRWNLNKSYLLELESKGVAIPKTIHISQDAYDRTHLMRMIELIPSELLVVKPAVSLNGLETYRIKREDKDAVEIAIDEIISSRDVLLQEYLPEIESGGELSFVFFNGEFSHAIRKTPRDGEFRIHREYGGKQISFDPTEELIRKAKQIFSTVSEILLYCRVDVVVRDDELVLIELEIIDPMLFLGFSADAKNRFARAIHETLSK